MSQNSSAVRPVDAELIYETPDKRKSSHSRKETAPEVDLVHEFESLFSSYHSLLQKFERETRDFKMKSFDLLAPFAQRIQRNAFGSVVYTIEDLRASESLHELLYRPLARLASRATELRGDFYALMNLYEGLVRLVAEQKAEDKR